MARNEFKNWATLFARDLGKGNTRILFERALARHVQTITAVRATGLSWPSIASVLAQEGVRRADGRLISSDHLRAAYSRVYAKDRHESRPARKTPAASALRADRFRLTGIPDSTQSEQSGSNPPSPTRSNHRTKHKMPPTPSGASKHNKRANNLRAAMQRAQNLRGKLSD